jgi:hypothetical protein
MGFAGLFRIYSYSNDAARRSAMEKEEPRGKPRGIKDRNHQELRSKPPIP